MRRMMSMILVLCLLLPMAVQAEAVSDLDRMLAKGKAFVEQGDFASAAICYDIAGQIAPDEPAVLAAVSHMYLQQKDYAKALEYVEQVLTLAPADGQAYFDKARLLFLMGRIDEALQAMQYGQICGGKPDESFVLTAAVSLAENGRYPMAVMLFESLKKEIWWDEYTPLYTRSLVLSGKSEKARQLGLIKTGDKDARLAAALESGRTLSLARMETEDLTQYPLYCSTAYYEANKETVPEHFVCEKTADGLRVLLVHNAGNELPEQLELLSVSPYDGTRLYSANRQLAILRNGQLTVITANPERGARFEEYEEQTYIYADRLGSMVEQDSIAWSPDGRYLAVTLPYRSIARLRLFDLILVDLASGELFVAEATPAKMLEGGQGALSAVFDATGENVYYLAYVNLGENSRSAIKKYHIPSQTVETVCLVEEHWMTTPAIWLDGTGALRGVSEVNKRNEKCGSLLFTATNGQWSYTHREFSNLMELQRPVRYLYSDNSGMEMSLNRCPAILDDRYITLSRDAVNTPMDNLAVLLPKEGNLAQEVTVDETFPEVLIGKPVAADEQLYRAETPWINVKDAVLSPDGYYAFILGSDGSNMAAYVLDLQTLRFAQLQLPQGVEIYPMVMAGASSGGKRIEWIDGEHILLPTQEGNLLCQITVQ